MRTAAIAAALALVTSTGCFSYLPPASTATAQPIYVVPAALGHDELAVTDKTLGTTNYFTFIDGNGHELKVAELVDRYQQIVGADDIHGAFHHNHVMVAIGAIAATAVLITFETLGIRACVDDGCTQDDKDGLVVAGALTALLAGVTIHGIAAGSDADTPLTRAQAEAFAARYNEALRRHAQPPATSVLDRARPTAGGLAWTF